MSQFSFFDLEDQLDKIHQLNDFLSRQGVLIKSGIIVDGIFVDVPNKTFLKTTTRKLKKGQTCVSYLQASGEIANRF
jgi:hypothetical protein